MPLCFLSNSSLLTTVNAIEEIWLASTMIPEEIDSPRELKIKSPTNREGYFRSKFECEWHPCDIEEPVGT